jgi:hypothetical protein
MFFDPGRFLVDAALVDALRLKLLRLNLNRWSKFSDLVSSDEVGSRLDAAFPNRMPQWC